ncbi:RNA-directed DNA polymerase, eukaryota, reverse transcriptase zinc-binding domain protein [Tanacetum coccineum]
MKKLDRIMANEDFNKPYQNAFGVFHPFMISDHSPAVVTIPNGLKKKRKAFRFMNYIADKKEFIECVESKWNYEIKGCNMYKVVQKLKRLKKPLNKLNWMNGNLTEKVAGLKKNLKGIQADVEKNPFDYDLKEKAVQVLNEYMEASNDELKLLQQKAKIKWYDGDKVAEAFVDHFKKFLGTKYVVQPLSSIDITFGKTLSEEEANEMIRMVSDEEIKEPIYNIDSNKASGPDGYTSGRHIQDNILIAQELLKGYKRKNGVRRCALKIDIQKAYDTINWDFLAEVLGKFGFHQIRINWIMTCVTTTKFSICVNGEAHGYFQGGRGLRQEDPISPYLFTLVMELSNMCIADDLLVLCTGDVESIRVVKKSMDQFSSISGLFPNLGKSTIFFGSVPLKASVYMLPDSTIKEVERLLKGFLWCQEGKDSLWVKWVNVVKLKGTSIWDIKANHNDSCGWKKLLDLRSRVKNHVFYKVGNGKNIFVWFDRWDIKGPLYDIIPKRVWYEERFSDNEKILNGMNDKVLWLNNQSEKKDFSTKQAWWDLRDNATRVEWFATQDRLAKWNFVTNPECLLCKKEMDSHSHLFFKCDYSKELWGKIKNKLVNMIDQDDLRTISSGCDCTLLVVSSIQLSLGRKLEAGLEDSVFYSLYTVMEVWLVIFEGGCSLASDAYPYGLDM